jgi:3-oxoacyl-[acyl-carrier-protein] synthase II
MKRVVITGLGPVSNIGVGIRAFSVGLREGRSGISRITSFDPTGFPHICAGEVHDFQPEEILCRLTPSSWGRSAIFAASAARLAVQDADLNLNHLSPERVGVAVGTTCGESQVSEAISAAILGLGFDKLSPALLRQAPGAQLSNAVSEELGSTGESLTISTACSASNYALGYAYDRLAHDEADVFVAGGADSVCRWVHAGFYRLGTLARDACCPFDSQRSGIITAEGGVALLLETLDHAQARQARVYAEVLGYGLNCDAAHMVAPNAASIAACMRFAHRNARVKPENIDYICAHGTGTRANDSIECQAIREVFGSRIPPVSSIKSMLGHTMGAASGFGAAACALAITDGFLPPTVNWVNPDPEMAGLDLVPNRSRPAKVRVVQNNGFAFGGNNAIVILGAVA